MTNILEKSLLIGFGIFTLLMFFILVMPFIEKITEYKDNDEENLEDYDNSYNPLRYKINYDIEWLQREYSIKNEVATCIKSISEEIKCSSFKELPYIKIITPYNSIYK